MQNGREGGVRHLRKRICALAAALWLTLALLAGTVSAQGDTEGSVEFTIQSAVVSESAVSLTVYIEPSGGAAVNGLNLSLSYEEGVRVESLLEGEAFGGALLADAGAPGGVWMIWDSADPYTGGKTVLFTVVFSLVPQAPEGLYAYGLSCRELYASKGEDGGLVTTDIPNNASASPIVETVWMGERLALTPSETTLIAGQTGRLTANKEVAAWTSSNESVVRVDGQGGLRALAAGTAVITAAGGAGGRETAQAVVRVLPRAVTAIAVKTLPAKTVYKAGDPLDLSGLTLEAQYNDGSRETVTSGFTARADLRSPGRQTVTVTYAGKETTFSVTVNAAGPASITSGTYTVKNGYLSKIPVGTTVHQLLAGLNERAYIRIVDKNGAPVASGPVTTGMTALLTVDGVERQRVGVVVTGDVNGDGGISITDMLAIKSKILKKSELSGCYAQAADTNGDGNLSITDFIQIKSHILKKSTIIPR